MMQQKVIKEELNDGFQTLHKQNDFEVQGSNAKLGYLPLDIT
jgi:hypothetical protein